jgi:predicted  nucleic acid-binding Zn-ribbon protein
VVTDPTADRTVTFQDADGTVALLSDITTLDSDLQAQITANDGDVTTLQAADVTLQNQITGNDGDITALQGADVTLQNQITANDGDIATLQAADVTHQSQITANDGDITNLQAADVTLQNQITANDGDITTLQTDVATAQTAADAAQSDVDGFDDALKNLTADEIGQLENLDSTTVSATQWGYLGSTDQATATSDSVRFAEIASDGGVAFEGTTADDFETSLVVTDPTADRTVTFQDADGTVALLSDISTLDSDLQAQITTNVGDITTLEAADVTLQNQITGNDGDITALQGADVTLQNQITANDGDITTLQAADVTLQNQITANDSDISTLTSRTLTAGTGLTGGGDLSANRSFAIANGGVGTTQLADDAVTDLKVVDALTVSGGTIDNSPIGANTPSSIAATTLVASTSVQLPDEGASPSAAVGMIRYNSAGYLEFYHEVSTGVFAWVPVNSYAP